ncbi:MAG: SsrA-binding protein SmpB [Parcubacteria group bacterium]|nr:SsrA-binding protein SmpB [Parcubacteria group bacterium]
MIKTIITNKKALFDYEALEKLSAGIALKGYEVKSVKRGMVDLTGSYVSIDQHNSVWIFNMKIAPYPQANLGVAYDRARPRALLLTRKEISSLVGKMREKRLTIIPLSVYTQSGLIKIEIGVCRGKKKYDKKEIIKKRDEERLLRREMKYDKS